jgi:hypothetical protein
MKNQRTKIVCTRCVYDKINIPKIDFDEDGTCSYFHQIDEMKAEYKTGTAEGEGMLEQIVERIKKAGKGKPYDCVMGVSGGTDSSYMAYLAVEKYGLRPLAVHLDNTFNNAVATENIRKVLGAIDAKTSFWGKSTVRTEGGKCNTRRDPVE